MPPIVAFVGPSNVGKTTLIAQLVEALRGRGYRVAAAKHAHHDFELDRPGKDSFRYREAGAEAVLLAAPRRFALIRDLDCEAELESLVEQHLADVQLILAEGFRRSSVPKIQVGAPISPAPRGEVIARVDGLTAAAAPEIFSSEEVERITDLLEARFLS